jgi:hypothetical protein
MPQQPLTGPRSIFARAVADPEEWVAPRFWHRLGNFRPFFGGSLAFAFANLI